MKIRDLFDVETAISFEVEKHTVTFYFRNATTDEEIEFRRRTSKQRIKDNGTLESTDSAIKAPLYLFERTCKRITIQNGDGQIEEVSPEEHKDIPEQLKLDAWAAHRSRIKKKEAEEIQD